MSGNPRAVACSKMLAQAGFDVRVHLGVDAPSAGAQLEGGALAGACRSVAEAAIVTTEVSGGVVTARPGSAVPERSDGAEWLALACVQSR